jgi:hypothetical protein
MALMLISTAALGCDSEAPALQMPFLTAGAGAAGTVATAGAAAAPTGGRGTTTGAAGRGGTAGSSAGAADSGATGADAASGGVDAGVGTKPDAGGVPADAAAEPTDAPTTDAAATDAAATDAAVDAAAEPREDLGEGDGSDVITIGDSWMSNTLGTGDGIEGALDRLTMQPYRNFGVQGVMLLSSSLFGPAVPTQYAAAKRANPKIKTVIMTGGGNDIIQNPSVQASCAEGGEACKQLMREISAALNTLWTEMAADGVEDVVYIRYAASAGSTDDSLRGMQDPIPICLTGKIRCYSVNTDNAVMDDLADGIHPTRAANDRIAKVVYELMEKEGMRR